ncbi:hypothetical protein EHI8A_161500 [Entamoeba histolytica HM-1:IMSS-B]|uniref:Uncharacterized protein n=6 Tax=Entamoeba histolytica TaxID=5759 RepID=C4M953_ENTH1|nr:hypothetical protein EHI_139850 [Entamoeba histolytica HM-1:IMSS]EMD45351.1 Hypothetical protein EHI5A_040940 [Entamoeba histolytica KU27]EMH76270.1 hypothetical protein EHI8A_161500 [Entamoeba histolytica HM-1:IMSS-B]EMS18041.1 hypothetical protein KM1_048810 [Entamoeba histolytica HM-3:IMSS]ENY66058.1 hypothetical protein EHI7A_145810 [Entamoeba histolytica HM-1:IMSS-A]GAT98172.1 hypothetical protein CL6EHI_139850 [Entamoeba histolytica]|eukprot:XP_649537.1 hypothetical protein EHI_139850 [Entamoeba histolytica HM-1:IMSS]
MSLQTTQYQPIDRDFSSTTESELTSSASNKETHPVPPFENPIGNTKLPTLPSFNGINNPFRCPNVVVNDDLNDKPLGSKFKTPAKRLSYLRERKILGRNEESEIIDGLQYLLIIRHHAVFYYVKEKRSKKTMKFRIPHSMELNDMKLGINELCEIGEKWLVERGLCERCLEKEKSQKRIQRSKEAEVNGALICIMDSLGYSFEFKKLKDKQNRKTTPFVKTVSITFPDGVNYSVEELKKVGRQYDAIMLQQDSRND